ncbi:MAG: tetratricopeptide repeat protein [Bryobacterales bacterium]|nr:tetratricopeptide repeat protein [Bryobacterales bacterium]
MRAVAAIFAMFFAAALAVAATPGECATARKIGQSAKAEACFAELARSSNGWYRAEAAWAAGNYEAAKNLFEQALRAAPANNDIRVRYGRLFMERFNKGEAQKLFGEALKADEKHAGALLAMATLTAEGFSSKAEELAVKAVEANPDLLEAHELLARLALERSRPSEARLHGLKAMELKPGEALDAMAVLAAADWLEDKPSTPYEQQALAINPRYSDFYAIPARIFVLQRRYREAIKLYEKAVALDGTNYRARSEMGINLMRLGRDEEARRQLETSFNADFRDATTVNTLRLLDSYKNFRLIRGRNQILRLHNKEWEPLVIYAQRELARAITTFNKKYRLEMTEPIQVEFYPDHEDFAVRTMGLPGLGALGVAFGDTVAMDSPSARAPGDFHWASTLWHELSHVYVLKLTDHKVPRWFTEGISVHEETQVSKEWGDRLDPPILKAIREKTLLPVANLDQGFQQPDTPTQVVVSYFQAGRIIDYIVEKWGWEKILQMVEDFKQMKTTAEVVQARLGLIPKDFDEQFLAWLDGQVGEMARAFPEWQKAMPALAKQYAAKNWDAVLEEGPKLRDQYPEFVGKNSVYEMLAEAYVAKGQPEKASEELWRYVRKGGRQPETIKKLGGLLAARNQLKEAADALERLNYIYPLDAELHAQLGDLYAKLGNKQGAITEYRALVAMKPVDLAGAHFRLARAYKVSNQNDKALDQVYLALELAPGYKEAQQLLLELAN